MLDHKTEPLSDLDIIETVLTGQIQFYELIVKRYNSYLYKIGKSYGFVHHDVQDIMQDTYGLVYGSQSISPEMPISGATNVAGMFLPNYRLFLMVIGVVIIFAVWLIVYRSRFGAMVRAAAFDKDMAASLGVPVARMYAGTFAFGVALAGLSGVLLAPIYSVFPTMGNDFLLLAFSVVIAGGLGSIKGTVIAGLVLTQIQSISSLYISPSWTDPLVFSIMVMVLMIRPQGLFGRLGHA